MKRAAGVEAFDVADAVVHLGAAFEQDRAVAVEGEEVGTDEPAGTGADHNGSFGQRMRTGFGHRERRLGMSFDLCQWVRLGSRGDSLFVRRLKFEVVNEAKVPLIAHVERLANDFPAAEIGGGNPEGAGEVSRQIGFGLLDGEPQVGNAERHAISLRALPTVLDSLHPFYTAGIVT